MSAQRHAIVAGAGVAGLSAAIALARIGWRVTVLERAALIEEVGAGIQISPNASRVLKVWGVLDRLSARALAPEALRVRRARDGRTIMRMSLGPIAELRWGAPYLVVHRADLIDALFAQAAREADIAIETSAAATGFAPSQDAIQVAVRRKDGDDRLDCDLLVGADGLRSTIRQRLGLGMSDRPIFSGRSAWRTLVRAERAPASAMRLETCLWLGPRAHLVHYPLRNGDIVNVVAIVEDGWRGAENGDIWSVAGPSQGLRPFFARWQSEARALVAAADEWRRWPLYDRNIVRRWSDSRVALIGDAAHPMMPFFAQGAAQSIEDADALGRALAQAGSSVDTALEAYQKERIPRTAAVQLASRRQGSIYHLTGPAAIARDFVMRRLSLEQMLRRVDWLYGKEA